MNPKTLECAQSIVEQFEKDDLLIFHISDYTDRMEEIQIYLAAKAYIERYG